MPTPRDVGYGFVQRVTDRKGMFLRYVHVVTGSPDTRMVFVVQTKYGAWFDLVGTADEHYDELARLNCDEDANIFCLVQGSDLEGRRRENIKYGRAVATECDQGAHVPSAEEPTCAVLSKAGAHVYFVCAPQSKGWPIDETVAYMRGAAVKMRTDPAIGTHSRILRLPGFDHVKDPNNRVLVTFWERADGKPHYFSTLKSTGFKPASDEEWRAYLLWNRVELRRLQVPGCAPLPAHDHIEGWIKNAEVRKRAKAWANFATFCACRQRDLWASDATAVAEENQALWDTLTPLPWTPDVPATVWEDRLLATKWSMCMEFYGIDEDARAALPQGAESATWAKHRDVVRAWTAKAMRTFSRQKRADSDRDAQQIAAEQPPFGFAVVTREEVVLAMRADTLLGEFEPLRGDLRTFDSATFITENRLGDAAPGASVYYCDCPFADDHASGVPSGAAFFPPAHGKDAAFHCFHAGCDGRTMSDVVRLYGPDVISSYCAVQLTDAQMTDRALDAEGLTRLGAQWPGCPQPDLVVPWPWQVGPDGVFNTSGGDAQQVAHQPMVITGRVISARPGAAELLELTWLRGDALTTRRVPRVTAQHNTKLVELADFGAPVNSENAKGLVRYLSDFEEANLSRLPRSRTTNHLGWQADSSFLLGDLHLRADGDGAHDADGLVCEPDTEGAQRVDSFTSAGTYENWLAAAKELVPYPRVMIGLYVSLAGPMLKLLRAPGFVFEWAGETSSGKTTAMRFAASAFGCNEPGDPGSVIRSWNTTAVGLERTCAILNDLPLFMDETQSWQDRPEKLTQVLYMLTNGTGRVRGTKTGGTREVSQWRIVTLSTGERQLGAFNEGAGGDKARVLSVSQPPFGAASTETRALVADAHRAFSENYGWVAPRFLSWLVANQEKADEWRDMLRTEQARLEQDPSLSRVGGRLAKTFAMVTLTARLVHEALGFDWDWRATTDAVWADITAGLEDTDRPLAALGLLYHHAVAYEGRMWRGPIGQPVPHNGWLGAWNADGSIDIIKTQAAALLKDAGYPPKATFDSLLARGLIDLGNSKARDGHQKAINGNNTKCVRILPSGIEVVTGAAPVPSVAPRWTVDGDAIHAMRGPLAANEV